MPRYSLPTEDKPPQFLFHSITENTSIKNINLKNLGLSRSIRNSEVHHCSTDVNLAQVILNSSLEACTAQTIAYITKESKIKKCTSLDIFIEREAAHTTIENCQSGSRLIDGQATQCTINSCVTEDSFLGSNATECTIKNCSAHLKSDGRKGFFDGSLLNCHVEKCFVFGRNYSNGNRSGGYGFVGKISGGFLKDCVIGAIGPEHFSFRIASEFTNELKNNYSIDSNPSSSQWANKNSRDGQSIPVALFTQRFFESNLDWDFENIWRWDDKSKQPALRHVGVNAKPQDAQATPKLSKQDSKTADLLIQQMRSNIWLF